jgi:ketosteroid isomerase-like protein
MDQEYTGRLLQTVRPAANTDVSDPQAVLHTMYDAVIQGNFEALGESLTDDAELHIHGFGAMDGSWRGRKDVVAAARKNFALVDSQQPAIERIISQGDSIVVLLAETGVLKASGQAYSIRAVQWFTFNQGKIQRIDQIVASRQ